MIGVRWMRPGGTLLALVIFAAAAFRLGRGAVAPAAETASAAQPEYGAPSARLLHRLAESADAYRTGETVYLVASDTFPYTVVGGFDSLEQARRLLPRMGPAYHVYPVHTPTDLPGRELAILPGCYKNDITTLWVCPKAPLTRALRMSDVRRIDVIYRLNAGDSLMASYAADSISAMIFTVDAFDRFIVPYYTKLFGPAYAARMRESVLAFAATAEPRSR